MKIIKEEWVGDIFTMIIEVPRVETSITQFRLAEMLTKNRENEIDDLVIERFTERINEILNLIEERRR